MEGYLKRNLNIFCLSLLHEKHMLRGEGNRKLHNCMMPHCSEMPIKVHIFNMTSVKFWVYNIKKSSYYYESIVKIKKENSEGIF
jgi:hypothetical protein